METGSENVTDEIQELVPERHCLETENQMDESGLDSRKSKYRRVTYAREFLIECFRHPSCSRKPLNPLPSLDCTLNTARLGSSPFTTLYVPPRRKEEGRKEPEDNISLRPQSGNFSSGCAPNLSPAHFPQNNYSRYPFQHEDPSKANFDKAFQRNIRFSNNIRPDPSERNRDPRDRGDFRDKNSRHPSNRKSGSLMWGPGPDGENHPEWIRRSKPSYERDHRGNQRGYNRYHDHRDDDVEPEWVTGGPTSQDETIELHGFQDDERRDALSKLAARVRANSGGQKIVESEQPSNHDSNNRESKVEDNKSVDMSINALLQMDHIAGILPKEFFADDSQPTGSSRFSKLFEQKPASPTPHEICDSFTNLLSPNTAPHNILFDGTAGPNLDGPGSKTSAIKDMEITLRKMLLNKKVEAPEPPKEAPKQEDLNAFKKLLEDLVIKSNKTGPQHESEPQEKGSGRPFADPPPGMQGMPFNPFAFSNLVAQPRPLQLHNPIAPNLSMNQVIPPNHVNRIVDPSLLDKQAHNQKRSATPVHMAFTPTAVMRKMTADQQSKSGASTVNNSKVTNYPGMSQVAAASAPSAFSNLSAPQPNPLSTFMSAVAQNQSQHGPMHQPQQQSVPLPNHPGHPHPGHVPLPHAGFHPQRVHFPVVVGHPNAGIPGQFPPFMVYPHQMSQRK